GGTRLRAMIVGPGICPSYPERTLSGSAGWTECATGRSWTMKYSLPAGTTRGPETWNAVEPSAFTQSAGSACVGNGATGVATGGSPRPGSSSVTNGLSLGLEEPELEEPPSPARDSRNPPRSNPIPPPTRPPPARPQRPAAGRSVFYTPVLPPREIVVPGAPPPLGSGAARGRGGGPPPPPPPGGGVPPRRYGTRAAGATASRARKTRLAVK